jgi:hypothetical protein
VNILAVIHPPHGFVVHVPNRLTQPRQLFADRLLADDRAVMTGQQELRLERKNAVQRLDEAQCLAIAIASHRDEIWKMPKKRA